MGSLTATNLLASIRRRAAIPTTAVTGTADSDLLAYANEELQLRMCAELMALREELFVLNSDTAISSSTTQYRIPSRAIGGKLRGVYLLDSSSNIIAKLPRIEPEQVEDWDTTGSTSAFYIENMDVVLVPSATTSAAYLRLSYYGRPNDITTTASDYATVSSVSGTTITTSAAHGFTTSTSLDIIKYTSGHESVMVDQLPTAASGSSITITGLVSGLVAGDLVCKSGKSVYPQIPADFHPILAQRVAVKVLQAGGWLQEAERAKGELAEMEAAARILGTPRVDSSPQKIVSRYGAVGRI